MTSSDSSRSESGQAMIFFAILASTMMLTLGLAVERGRMFVTFRQMQSAADMAALVGAQSLPSASQASADALQYAQENGFSSSQTTVCIPPKVISPYSVINYTASGNAPCSNQNDHYIEVQITDNLDMFGHNSVIPLVIGLCIVAVGVLFFLLLFVLRWNTRGK